MDRGEFRGVPHGCPKPSRANPTARRAAEQRAAFSPASPAVRSPYSSSRSHRRRRQRRPNSAARRRQPRRLVLPSTRATPRAARRPARSSSIARARCVRQPQRPASPSRRRALTPRGRRPFPPSLRRVSPATPRPQQRGDSGRTLCPVFLHPSTFGHPTTLAAAPAAST